MGPGLAAQARPRSRQLRVLEQVAAGAPIHMRRLHTKLGAHRRAEVVTRAGDLGLLAPSARSGR